MRMGVIGPTLNTYYGIDEIAKHHEIKALFTLPPELGLKKARYTLFEDQAEKYDFDIFYDEHRLNDDKVIKKFKSLNLDLIVELGSSKIIPFGVIESSRYGCIGSHGARLPYVKGGASMNWAIINGETDWGVSIYYLNYNVDEGRCIETMDFDIDNRDDINTVHNKSDLVTAKMLGNFLSNFRPMGEFKDFKLETIKLNPSPKGYDWKNIVEWNKEIKRQYRIFKKSGKAIFLPQRKPQDGFIDWSSSSTEIYNFIRAQTAPHFQSAFTIYNGKKLFILEADVEHKYVAKNEDKPGKIVSFSNKGDDLLVNTGTSGLIVKKVRYEGFPEMWAKDLYYELEKMKLGDCFGE